MRVKCDGLEVRREQRKVKVFLARGGSGIQVASHANTQNFNKHEVLNFKHARITINNFKQLKLLFCLCVFLQISPKSFHFESSF